MELLTQYDEYIIEFFNDERHLEGDVPVCVNEFYDNEFLGYAEEEAFSWKLYKDSLQYSFAKKENNNVDITVGALTFSILVPRSVYDSDAQTLTEYIEDRHGETIFHTMNAVLEAE